MKTFMCCTRTGQVEHFSSIQVAHLLVTFKEITMGSAVISRGYLREQLVNASCVDRRTLWRQRHSLMICDSMVSKT